MSTLSPHCPKSPHTETKHLQKGLSPLLYSPVTLRRKPKSHSPKYLGSDVHSAHAIMAPMPSFSHSSHRLGISSLRFTWSRSCLTAV